MSIKNLFLNILTSALYSLIKNTVLKWQTNSGSFKQFEDERPGFTNKI
jgi:hypothetical protein